MFVFLLYQLFCKNAKINHMFHKNKEKHAPRFRRFIETKPVLLILSSINGTRQFIRRMYKWVIGWAEKPQAEKALGGLSFAESSFFPIPPDPLLIAMVTARPKKWFRLATITTFSSVAGGLFGYLIGFVAIAAVMPIIINVGYEDAYYAARDWFNDFGALAVIVAAFTPIPYKIFTIAGGAAAMSIPLFVVGSIIGRGVRFYLVAFLMYHFGKRFKDKIEKYIDILGFAFIVILILGFVSVRYIG